MAEFTDTPEKGKSVLIPAVFSQLEAKIMSKYEKTGATATESVSEPNMGTETATKEELPVYQEITGLITAIKQIEAPVLAFPQSVHNVATAAQKAADTKAELNKLSETPAGKLLLALAGDKINSLDVNLTDAAKKAVNVQVAATRQILKNISAAVDAIEAKYGTVPIKPAVPTPKSKATGLGNITADNQADIEDMLKSRGYEEIAFELQSDGVHYRVYATKPGNKPRDTLFSSNVNRDWL